MEENKSNKYFLGIIGAILGAFIGAIPWILIYVYANMMIAIVSVLIAIGSYFGYKFTKATIDKKLPIIIGSASILAITVSTFFIIPIIIFKQQDIAINFGNLKIIYQYSGFIRDFIISIVFTVIGISGVLANIHRQIKEGVSPENIKVTNQGINQQFVSGEELEAVRNVFTKYNALDKTNTISKEDVINELNTQVQEIRANQIFNVLKAQGAIKKSSGKFYFSEKNAKNPFRKGLITALVTVGIVFAILFVIVILAMNSDGKNTSKSNKTKNVSNSTNNSAITPSEYQGNVDVNESEHVISDTNIKFVPTSDMLILTDNEIEQYMGQGYSQFYEFVSVNSDISKMLYCFKIDNSNNYTAEQYIQESLKDVDYGEIKKETIAGLEFSKAEILRKEDEGDYKEECYVYLYDNTLLCMDYWHLATQENNLAQMFQVVENNN